MTTRINDNTTLIWLVHYQLTSMCRRQLNTLQYIVVYLSWHPTTSLALTLLLINAKVPCKHEHIITMIHTGMRKRQLSHSLAGNCRTINKVNGFPHGCVHVTTWSLTPTLLQYCQHMIGTCSNHCGVRDEWQHFIGYNR